MKKGKKNYRRGGSDCLEPNFWNVLGEEENAGIEMDEDFGGKKGGVKEGWGDLAGGDVHIEIMELAR